MLCEYQLAFTDKCPPHTQDLVIALPEKDLIVNLDSEGIEVVKYPDGKLKELHFTLSINRYSVFFWPDWKHGKEQVKFLQKFELIENCAVPDGEWLSFSSTGTLVSRQNWRMGKLHGTQQVFTEMGIPVSESFYPGL